MIAVRLGLNNRASYDASYFWARTLGSGARRPAPGIGVDADSGLRWLDDDEAAARNLAPQTGDGKFSEWVDFLAVGDELDLVPHNPLEALELFGGRVHAVTRAERPAGAQPLVAREPVLWTPR